MSLFDGVLPSFAYVPAAGKALPYDAFEALQNTVVSMGTALISGVSRARVYNTAVQSLSNVTLTALTFNTEDWDINTLHSTSVNTSRMTCPSGGTGAYILIGKTTFAGSASGVARVLRFRKNGTDEGTERVSAPNANPITLELTAIVGLNPTEYIELFAYQDSGGSLNVGDASTRVLQSELTVARLW